MHANCPACGSQAPVERVQATLVTTCCTRVVWKAPEQVRVDRLAWMHGDLDRFGKGAK